MITEKISGQSLIETVILNALIVSGILLVLSETKGWVHSFVASFLDLTAGPLP